MSNNSTSEIAPTLLQFKTVTGTDTFPVHELLTDPMDVVTGVTGVVTVSVAELEVTDGGQVPETLQRNL